MQQRKQSTHLRAALVLGAMLVTVPAAAEDLYVEYDQAKILRLSEPAANIIVGNPSIADVTVHSGSVLVLTGKTFGVTNLIILNKDDKVILNTRLMVKSDTQKIVSLNRGGMTATYNCMPKCEPMMKVGDDSAYLSSLTKSADQKIKFSEGGGEQSAN